MSWNDVIGQERVKGILVSTLKAGRLPHAYLFSGQPGVGKDAAAIELVKTLLCERKGTEACDECPECRRVAGLQHPNLRIIISLPVGKNEQAGDHPLAKVSEDDLTVVREQLAVKAGDKYHRIRIPRATGIKINSIRELRRESSLTAFQPGMKIFIISDADDLNDESANALLKTLEEPHPDTLLILTASRPDTLLPTIISRCQHIHFDPLREEDIRDALVRREGLDPGEAAVIGRLAGGSYARGRELAGTTLQERQREAVDFVRTALYRTRQEILHAVEHLTGTYDRQGMEELLLLMQDWLRDAMNIREGHRGRVTNADLQTLEKFVAHQPGIDYPAVIGLLDREISVLRKNVYIPLILTHLAVELKHAAGSMSSPNTGPSAKEHA